MLSLQKENLAQESDISRLLETKLAQKAEMFHLQEKMKILKVEN
jgi:hypothetical protein